MSKNHLRITRTIGAGAVAFACSLLAFSVPNAGAQTSVALGNAVRHALLHQSAGSHNLAFYRDSIHNMKQLVIVPEPNTGALLALGGLVCLAAWRLRKRVDRSATSS